ncbi:hypothetical protein ACP70R_020704 [Stipagrostis hirtigluma subsp. patula]
MIQPPTLSAKEWLSPATTMTPPGGSEPLLAHMDGAVDHRGRPPSSTGGWNSALFIIAVGVAERFAFYGVSANLMSYMTGPLGDENAAAAAAINAWSGAAQLLPLLGGAIADSCGIGRYRTILLSSVLYVLGLVMLSLSALSWGGRRCSSNATAGGETCSPSTPQVAFFYLSLYLVAVAQGGHKPCIQAFGADQFDPADESSVAARSSFFNWWSFGLCIGVAITTIFLSYVQDNIGWGLGFGISSIVMACSLVMFLLGTRTYRNGSSKQDFLFHYASKASATSQEQHTAATQVSEFRRFVRVEDDTQEVGRNAVDDAKDILRLFPIWASFLMYAVAFAQTSTFFTKQAATLDRRIGQVIFPPASLCSLISITQVIVIPIYDAAVVPLARRCTGIPSGFTMLQRVATGMVLALLCMVTAALVERERLRAARDAGGLLPVPMSVWMMVPQYVLFGVADVFAVVALQEFFYDQVPDKLQSLGCALIISIFGVGSFISSALVSVVDRITAARGRSWFSNDLNNGHLDYFYWLLAALSALDLVVYLFFAAIYKYKKTGAEGS